jgi:hypothetical protein
VRAIAVDRNASAGARLAKFTAHDADADRFGQVTYRLEGSPDQLLRIDNKGWW